MSKLSIIIPVLNEGDNIAAALDALAHLRALGTEVIVVDGGSRDATVERAKLRADRVVLAPRGRALQMNAGAERASGDVLLFLHADTRLPAEASRLVLNGLDQSRRVWGRFDVKIDGRSRLLPVVAWLMRLRSRLTGIAPGDQAICKRLKRLGRPLCLHACVTTSGRRWEKNGVLSTILLMWRLRFAYFLGADPNQLARQYGYE
jgi:glycosyltransferase involved in cell wall biosynthesis